MFSFPPKALVIPTVKDVVIPKVAPIETLLEIAPDPV